MLSTWILAWGHVISAIGWLGGGMVFVFVVAPALSRMSPASSGEFLVKVVPGVVRFFQVFAGLTILFGFLLLYNMGGSSLLTNSTFYGVDLSVGIVLALAAFVVSEFVAAPLQLKAVRQIQGMLASGSHTPPAEFPRTLQLASYTAILTAVLLILTSICMVGAGFY
ncbi:MAG TPA: hypothetical protein VN864_05045 [Thermoplasmata archaeon]|nr:hypothetical protein [Thermoplasmata archaeon]